MSLLLLLFDIKSSPHKPVVTIQAPITLEEKRPLGKNTRLSCPHTIRDLFSRLIFFFNVRRMGKNKVLFSTSRSCFHFIGFVVMSGRFCRPLVPSPCHDSMAELLYRTSSPTVFCVRFIGFCGMCEFSHQLSTNAGGFDVIFRSVS